MQSVKISATNTSSGLIEDVKSTSNAIDVNIKSGSIPAGTGLIGKVGIDQVTANANEVVVKTSALPSGGSTSALQTTGNNSLSSIDYKAYKGKDRTTTTGAAEELTIPANSKKAILSCAPLSQAYVEINGDATTSSPLYIEDPFGPLILDLGSVTKLSAWVVAGNLGVVFYG